MRQKAFIFDLDGVIVDTAKYHYLAWRELAHELGFDFSEEQNELLKGVSRERSLDILLDIGKISLSEEERIRCLAEKNAQYLSFIDSMDQSEILPGIAQVLHFLKANNIPFSLGSASKNARHILENLGLLDLFDAIVDGNDVSTAKPDPEVFLLAAERLQVDPGDCVVVEDALAGIEAARRAGMTSIGIGDKSVLGEANYVLSNTGELSVAFIMNLLAQKN